ncbi:MAG: outer membrane beta-barrel protein [Desulfatitalea sp.]|nr:porin family protein [Desulfatitalea sp.]NNJ98997.1 outer membrane beta-barrel protein [Desulfatitalea sp.]
MRTIIFFVILALLSPAIIAADTKIGVSPAYVMLDISDPDGSTDDCSGFHGIGVTTIHDLNNKLRIMGVINYYDFEVDPLGQNIGQGVSSYQVGAYLQRIVRVARSFNFYAGAGLAYTMADFEKRHTTDADGYLLTRYPDRSEGAFSAMANLSKEWEISNKFEIGADISYQYGIGDIFSGFKGALSLLYKF